MNGETLSVALKEWDLVIRALLDGRQHLLLRKGGILESDNQFELEYPRFLFYPTFIHQDPHMVKPEWRSEIRAARAEPTQVELCGYGEVARIFEIPPSDPDGRRKLEALCDLHLWDAPMLDMRFAYRAEKPLYLVAIRAFRLPTPIIIENSLEYAGCKSWIPLKEAIDVSHARPAVSPEALQTIIARIARTLA